MVRGAEQDIIREIRESLETGGTTEEPVARAARALREYHARGQVRCSEWSEGEGLLMFGGRIYVPDDKDLRRRIMSLYHDSRVAGHPGRAKTLELILRDYWWPQMAQLVGLYTRTCQTCIQNKVIC